MRPSRGPNRFFILIVKSVYGHNVCLFHLTADIILFISSDFFLPVFKILWKFFIFTKYGDLVKKGSRASENP